MSRKNLKVATYLRVASAEQAQLGYSLESQRAKLREYAEMNNLEIEREFSDIGSGIKTNRQGYQEMLKFLEDSTDCKSILVTKADRLSRDFETYSEVQQKYSVISVDYGASDMMNQLQMMLAQQYSKHQSERIKAGIKKSKERGKEMADSKTTSSENKASVWLEEWVTSQLPEEKKVNKVEPKANASQWIENWVEEASRENNIEGEKHGTI